MVLKRDLVLELVRCCVLLEGNIYEIKILIIIFAALNVSRLLNAIILEENLLKYT